MLQAYAWKIPSHIVYFFGLQNSTVSPSFILVEKSFMGSIRCPLQEILMMGRISKISSDDEGDEDWIHQDMQKW
jgi:hypothetical protein